jgi:S-DNA-T family DNA segregation ATPase FtsK/SpoIIIE
MNMLANIATKMCLYLNDEGDLTQLMGRDRLLQVDTPGRGQVMLDAPTAIQFYLPAAGADSAETLTALETQIAALDTAWTGVRPLRIPMVPQELAPESFARRVAEERLRDTMHFGLNKTSALPEGFGLFEGKPLGIFPENGRQAGTLYPFLAAQVLQAATSEHLVVIDAHDTLKSQLGAEASLYLGKRALNDHAEAVKTALADLVEHGSEERQCVVINGMTDVLDRLMLPTDQVAELLSAGSKNVQVIVLDQMSKVNSGFGLIGTLKENLEQILFGGDLGTQRFVDNLSLEAKRVAHGRNILHSFKNDELTQIVIPTVPEREE